MEEFETGVKRKRTYEEKENTGYKGKETNDHKHKKHADKKPYDANAKPKTFDPKVRAFKKRDAKASRFVSYLFRPIF
jgi:hypothetical protein